MTLVFTSREELKLFLRNKQEQKMSIGFVPTMGALHDGHGTLMKQCVSENDVSVVSLFVNPKQFGLNEDLSKYPRPFQKDLEFCQSLKVDVLFAPSVEEIYPSPFLTQISLPDLSHFMCGKFRPHHFDGVATVVMLLLNIVKPNFVYFGQKDFQQVQIVKQMVKDLASDVHVVLVPTIRQENGLALSSRNVYLSEQGLKLALVVPHCLGVVGKLFLEGERSVSILLHKALEICEEKKLTPQYLECRKIKNLSEEVKDKIEEDCILALALFIPPDAPDQMPVRLIDNIVLSDDSIWIKKLEELIQATQNL